MRAPHGLSFLHAISGSIAWMAVALCSFVLTAACAAETEDDRRAVPSYQPTTKLSGRLHIVASHAMASLMREWVAGFQRHHPAVGLTLETGTSSQAAHALGAGHADVAAVTRTMTPNEAALFEHTYGHSPEPLPVALDAVIVIVHNTNPVDGMSMEQLRTVFSDPGRGSQTEIARWGDVGAGGSWADAAIHRYALDLSTASAQFFADAALNGQPFRHGTIYLHDNASVVSALLIDRHGIGFTSIGFLRDGIKALALSKGGENRFTLPSEDTIQTQAYPLARTLYVYLNARQDGPALQSVREFWTYVRSRDGEAAVRRAQFTGIAQRRAMR